ncbi:MAG: cytochrome c family protein [Pseudomonadota bacterium]
MLDTMTLTKVTAALCGSLLVFMLGGWVAEEIYHIGGKHHGEDHHQAYSIAVESAEEEVIDEGPSFAELFAVADAGKGERVWGKCRACHQLEPGANGTGPTLYAVVGRVVHSEAEFGYSGALAEVVDVWSPENLDGFLENPKGYAPGTSMGFAGLKKPEDRANLIAYLQTIGG